MRLRFPISAFALLLALPSPTRTQTPNSAHPIPETPDPGPETRSTPHSTLRIGLWTLWHDKQLTLAPTPYTPYPTPDSGPTLRLCPACIPVALTRPTLIRASNSELLIPNHPQVASITVSGPITLSAHDETITLRHPLTISARNGQLVLAVALPLETYVERVVSSESGLSDTPESLKALAVVVRSFALHQPHAHSDYDLCDSTHCQLLHWSAAPSPSAHAATLATSGETLWYHGRPAAAFFHQDCGGRTASPSELWPLSAQGRESASSAHNTSGTPYTRYPIPHTPFPMPWLVSRADPYCTANGVRSWSADLSLADLTTALSAAGLVRPGWRTLTVARRGDPALGQSPRPITLLAGSTEISAEDFRLAVGRAFGWGHVLSTWFEIAPQGDHFLFNGRGSGHGVGLCQHGAAAMAARAAPPLKSSRNTSPAPNPSTSPPPAHGSRFLFPAPRTPWSSKPSTPQQTSYLPALAQALSEAQSRSGLQPSGPLTVRAYHSTTAFRDATLAPGWVAAFAEGNFIATQPLATLSSRVSCFPPSATNSSTLCSKPIRLPTPHSGSAKASLKSFLTLRPPRRRLQRYPLPSSTPSSPTPPPKCNPPSPITPRPSTPPGS
jgi:stage II sporulation protein D